MDPLTLIVTALTTGVAIAAKDTATQAVRDAYSGLKALIQKHFADKPEAKTALEQFEKKPDVWKAPLEDALKEKAVDKDEVVVKMAQELLKLIDPHQAALSKYNIQINRAFGTAIGDQASVHINTETPDQKD